MDDILCEHFERSVGKDNCVQFENLKLQILCNNNRMHYMKVQVRVHRYLDATLGIVHGPMCIARYSAKGCLINDKESIAA